MIKNQPKGETKHIKPMDIYKHNQQISKLRKETYCRLEFKNGSYQGSTWEKNNTQIISGNGVFYWYDSSFYFGQWLDNQPNGKGIFFFPHGGYLISNFNNGTAEGSVEILYPNNDIFRGKIQDGVFEGECLRYFSLKDKWVILEYKGGQVLSLVKEGQGSINDDSYLVKTFKESIPSLESLEEKNVHRLTQNQLCICIKKLSNDQTYYGTIQNKKPNGIGVIVSNNSKEFKRGTFINSKLNGRGRYNFTNGDVYDGDFLDEKFDNLGVYYNNEDKTWFYGTFLKNQVLKTIQHGSGEFPPILNDFCEYDREKGKQLYPDNTHILKDITIDNNLIDFIEEEALYLLMTLHLKNKPFRKQICDLFAKKDIKKSRQIEFKKQSYIKKHINNTKLAEVLYNKNNEIQQLELFANEQEMNIIKVYQMIKAVPRNKDLFSTFATVSQFNSNTNTLDQNKSPIVSNNLSNSILQGNKLNSTVLSSNISLSCSPNNPTSYFFTKNTPSQSSINVNQNDLKNLNRSVSSFHRSNSKKKSNTVYVNTNQSRLQNSSSIKKNLLLEDFQKDEKQINSHINLINKQKQTLQDEFNIIDEVKTNRNKDQNNQILKKQYNQMQETYLDNLCLSQNFNKNNDSTKQLQINIENQSFNPLSLSQNNNSCTSATKITQNRCSIQRNGNISARASSAIQIKQVPKKKLSLIQNGNKRSQSRSKSRENNKLNDQYQQQQELQSMQKKIENYKSEVIKQSEIQILQKRNSYQISNKTVCKINLIQNENQALQNNNNLTNNSNNPNKRRQSKNYDTLLKENKDKLVLTKPKGFISNQNKENTQVNNFEFNKDNVITCQDNIIIQDDKENSQNILGNRRQSINNYSLKSSQNSNSKSNTSKSPESKVLGSILNNTQLSTVLEDSGIKKQHSRKLSGNIQKFIGTTYNLTQNNPTQIQSSTTNLRKIMKNSKMQVQNGQYKQK